MSLCVCVCVCVGVCGCVGGCIPGTVQRESAYLPPGRSNHEIGGPISSSL